MPKLRRPGQVRASRPPVPRPRRARVEDLEPRVLLSADLPGAPLAAALPPASPLLEASATVESLSAHTSLRAGTEQHVAMREVVFVDAGVEGHEALVRDLLGGAARGRDLEVVVLDAGRDGLAQIGEVLAAHAGDVGAVHIVSHGTERGVQLGGTWLTHESLEARASSVAGWAAALGDDADLLLYGCNLAASAEGRALVDALASLTGADVAASTDLTGATALGGDWELEFATGSVETRVALGAQVRQEWSGVLATINVDTFADVVDAGDGLTSLREAIQAANADSVADTIVLPAGTYTLDLGGAGEDAAGSGDLDVSEDLVLVGAGAESTVLDATGLGDRVFQILNSSSLTLSGITIQNGDAAINAEHGGGAYVALGSDLTLEGVVVSGNDAVRGGGIYNVGTLTLIDVEIRDNGDLVGTLTGGGLDNQGSATLARVTLSGNSADVGAGLHQAAAATDLSLVNVTVSGNQANTAGGGLYAQQSVTIENSTFTNNSADSAGGILKTGGVHTVELTNSIVGGNAATSVSPDVQGTFASQGFNIIGDSSGGSGFVASDQLGVDPRLDPVLRDNGGPTRTHALLVGSPALDAGSPAVAPLFDQRGLLRDSRPDVGAYESAAPAVALWVTTDKDVVSSGAAELPSWDAGEVIQLSTPDLAFGSPSDGTWSSVVDFDSTLFSDGDVELYALHYVGTQLTLGGNGAPAVELVPGDLLLVSKDPELWKNPGPAPDVNATGNDVVLFHPDRPGDYGSGTFSILLENPLAKRIEALTLAEAATQVGPVAGGTLVPEGAFLIATDGSKQVVAFTVDDVGAGTTAIRDLGGTPSTTTLLLDGPDFGLEKDIAGLELIESEVRVGGILLGAGDLLVAISDDDSSVGNPPIAVQKQDIVRLDVLATGSVSDAKADLFLQGSGVHLDSGEEAVQGFTLIPNAGDTVLTANDDSASAAAATPTVLDVLQNDTGDPITVFDFTLPADGNVVQNPDGTLTYTSNPAYSGVDTFDYVVTDGRENTIHYWKLDGDASDTVGSSDGVVVGATQVGGHYGSALAFDEVDDRVVIPTFSYPASGEFTVAFRFKVDDNVGSAFQSLYSHGVLGAKQSLNVYIGESGSAFPDTLVTNLRDSNDLPGEAVLNVDVSGLIGDGLWHTFTLAISDAGSEVFVDGVSRVISNRGKNSFSPGGTDLFLGAREDLDPNSFYGGALDSVQILDGALDPAAVLDLHTGGARLATVSVAVSSPPTIAGTVSGQGVDDDATLAPFSGVTISDPNPGDPVTVTVTLSDGDDNGGFTAASLTASGFTQTGVGEYSLGSGTPAAAQAAIRQLVFDPTENQVAPGSVVTTTFTIEADDSVAATTDNTTSVDATSINDASTVGGTVAGQAVGDDATVAPFAAVTISDVDAGETLTVTVTLSDGDANGAFTAASLAASGFTKTGAGEYTLAASTPGAAQAAIRQLVFGPTESQVASGSVVTTTFTIEVDDGDETSDDDTTTVDATSINYAPAGSNRTVTTFVDTPYTFNIGDFGFSDPNDVPGDSLLGVEIATAPDAGTLARGGTTLVGGEFVSAADIAGNLLTFTPDPGAGGASYTSFTFQVRDDGGTAGGGVDLDPTSNVITVDVAPAAFWLNVKGDSDPSDTNLASWKSGDVVEFGVGATFGFTTTSGPFDFRFKLQQDDGATVTDANLRALHYVTRTLTLGSGADTFTVQPGDVISALKLPDDTAVTLLGTNTLDVTRKDVFLFRPDTPGNYSAGTFTMLLENPVNENIHAISLVEKDTALGDSGLVLPGGSFLLAHSTPGEHDDVFLYTPTGVGELGTAGGKQLILEGSTLGFSDQVQGLELLEEDTRVGDTVIPEGRLLVTLDKDNTVSGLAVTSQDIVALRVLDTELGAGTSVTASILFDGSDVALAAAEETFDGLALGVGSPPAGNTAPTIGGTAAGQAVDDDATVSPFSAVTISDPDFGELLTVTVTLSGGDANGAFTAASLTASGFAKTGVGTYELSSVSAAGAQTALRQLVFDPTENQVAPGGTVTTTFTLEVDDGDVAPSDATTTVVATSINDAPQIGGTAAGQPVDDHATVSPFSAVTISDADLGESVTVVVTLSDGDDNGVFTAASLTASGFSKSAVGEYTLGAGTPGAAQTALRQLVFDPTENQVAPGGTVTTTFTIGVDDGEVAPTDASTTVVATSINDAPQIGGTAGGQPVDDNATVSPFSAATISDADFGELVTVTVTLSGGDANGAFTAASLAASGFTKTGAGTYKLGAGTPGAAQTAIRQLVFDPTENQVAPGGTVTTTFTIGVDDGEVALTDASTTVVATSINDAPQIGGTAAGQPVNDNATVLPLSAVTISDADSGESVTVVVTLSGGDANGIFTAASLTASGFSKTGVGQYTLGAGTPGAAQTAIRQLVFDPTENQVAPGGTVTTTFTIGVDDGDVAPTDASTTVVATSINDAPQIGGTAAGQRVNDNATILPFAAVTISDVDFGESVTVVVTLSGGDANGVFTAASLTASGFSKSGVGEYTLGAGTPGAAQTAIRQLVFDPTDNQVTSGGTVTTIFTIEVDDGEVAPSDATTTVVATPPTITVELPPIVPEPPPPPKPPPANAGAGDEEDEAPASEAPAAPVPEIVALGSEEPVAPRVVLEGGAGPAILVSGTSDASLSAAREAGTDLRESDRDPASTEIVERFLAGLLPGVPLADLVFLDQRTEFLGDLDRLRNEIETALSLEARVVGSSVAVTTGLSVGYVLWLTRGGLLLASLVSSMPAWRLIDPVPVLAALGGGGRGPDDDDESLESLVGGWSRPKESSVWRPATSEAGPAAGPANAPDPGAAPEQDLEPEDRVEPGTRGDR